MGKLKIIALVGISGSGKSTWAEKFCSDLSHSSFVRINKDSIRVNLRKLRGLSDDARVNEKEVVDIEDKQIINALEMGMGVVWDNTHLNPIHINERLPKLLKDNNLTNKVQVVVDKSFLDVPIETCIERDAQRTGIEKVGEAVIRSQWKQAQQWLPKDYESYLPRLQTYDGTKPKAIIVDLDGSLFLLGDRGRWDEHLVEKDLPNIPVVNTIRMYLNNPNYKVLFVSGRKDSCWDETVRALKGALDIPTNPPWYNILLFMRGDKDNRKDTEVKKEIYLNDIEPKFFVEAVFDDRVSVVDMWRNLGLFVFDLNQTRKEF